MLQGRISYKREKWYERLSVAAALLAGLGFWGMYIAVACNVLPLELARDREYIWYSAAFFAAMPAFSLGENSIIRWLLPWRKDRLGWHAKSFAMAGGAFLSGVAIMAALPTGYISWKPVEFACLAPLTVIVFWRYLLSRN